MCDALKPHNQQSAEEALLKLSNISESNAIKIAHELTSSLRAQHADSSTTSSSATTTNTSSSKSSDIASSSSSKLPSCLQHHRRTQSATTKSNTSSTTDPLVISKACTESILASLSRVASGGSQASSDLRRLESLRRHTDAAAHDINSALQLRHYATRGADALGARLYKDAARAIEGYRNVKPTDRALVIAGPHSRSANERTRDVLQRTVLEQYENAVSESDLKGLSEMTPLLGMLDLADKGVGLYLKYSQNNLSQIMNEGLEKDNLVESKQMMEEQEENQGVKISRAEQRRRDEQKRSAAHVTVCTKLAKIFNVAVTHLRHHLPMVAYALGNADGDAALVQLVHLEVERRATAIIREYLGQKNLSTFQKRARGVANMLEEKYLNGDGGWEDMFHNEEYGSSLTLKGVTAGIDASDGYQTAAEKAAALDRMDDCGFRHELGTYPAVNAQLDEMALLLQHTESYERFVRHAVEEVNKARSLRATQKRDARKREWMQKRLENEDKEDVTLEESELFDKQEEELEKTRQGFVQDVLPAQTQLNELVAEVGGYLSGMERTFLLASIQRALFSVGFGHCDPRTYSPLTILPSSRGRSVMTMGMAGCHALQSSIVEECLYAAQQSTLRAFATGHNGTACAATNVCTDILGRVLLDALSQRAEMGTSLLRPGDGLIVGAGGIGQAAMSVMTSAQKGLSNVATRSATKNIKRQVTVGTEEEERRAMKFRIETGVARCCATLNDMEVAVDYTRRLEEKFIHEVESTFARGTSETEQLKVCIQALSGVMDSYQSASNQALEHLTGVIMPRVRSIVNECVGQESAAATGFTNVMGGVGMGSTMSGTSSAASSVKMNYDLDDAAFEMAQISEGYMSKL